MTAQTRLLLVNDTSAHANWGCQATSAGLKILLANQFGGHVQVDAAPALALPFSRSSFRGYLVTRGLLKALKQPVWDAPTLGRFLAALDVDLSAIDRADYVVVNGEGMVHDKSRHLPKLLGVLAYAKAQGKKAAMINQTIDLLPSSLLRPLLVRVYGALDRAWVRDPMSLNGLKDEILGLELVPDAAFLSGTAEVEAVSKVRRAYELPARYIAVTGSSALRPNDPEAFAFLCEAATAQTGLPLVMLASTKTDRKLAASVQSQVGFAAVIDDNDENWQGAASAIAGADALIGGRFHPMVFAALNGTPILGCAGNTHKSEGLLALLEYGLPAFRWDDRQGIRNGLSNLHANGEALGARLQEKAQAAVELLAKASL